MSMNNAGLRSAARLRFERDPLGVRLVRGRTKQSFKAECDIKNIMARYSNTGLVAHVNAHPGAYMDLPDELDYQAALNVVHRADEAFSRLPSKVRSRFENDPQAFLAFVTDPANKDELVKLGLTKEAPAPKVDPPAPPVVPVNPVEKPNGG